MAPLKALREIAPKDMRHVLITGGSRGIGLSIAHLFARHAYRCTLVARNRDALRDAVAALPNASPATSFPHTFIAGDVTAPTFWTTKTFNERWVEQEQFRALPSRVDVLVNCAGVGQNRLFVGTEGDEVRRVVDTNLTSLMVGTRFLLRRGYVSGRKEQKEAGGQVGQKTEGKILGYGDGEFSPVIINVASLLGLKGGVGAVAYAASKAGVLGFTRALAAEQGPQGVRVNAIVPGYIETDMTSNLNRSALLESIPLKRFGRPEEIAQAALFLAQNQYAHNSVINLDGGLSAT